MTENLWCKFCLTRLSEFCISVMKDTFVIENCERGVLHLVETMLCCQIMKCQARVTAGGLARHMGTGRIDNSYK